MMKRFPLTRRTTALLGFLVPLFALLVYVILRSGPLAPVPVTVAAVESRTLSPALYGIGTVEARYTYRIGPTSAGRVKSVNVHAGDRVRAGQVLGEMDPVDLDERIDAQKAALKRAQANVLAAEAQLEEMVARESYAQSQAHRYEQILVTHAVSKEAVESRRQEWKASQAGVAAARANLDAMRQELGRVGAEHAALRQQRGNLLLVSPIDGLVTARAADPATTVVAGQPVVEVIDPASLWINVRFDQARAIGLRADLPARVLLRSRAGEPLKGRVLRVEPLADAVTEELLAKVVFDVLPDPLPAVGELGEVTVALPALAAAPVVPNASIQRFGGQRGVWRINDDAPHFTPVKLGAGDLDGKVQVLEGLKAGDRVVVYSQRALVEGSRIAIVDRLPGVAP